MTTQSRGMIVEDYSQFFHYGEGDTMQGVEEDEMLSLAVKYGIYTRELDVRYFPIVFVTCFHLHLALK